MNGINVNAILLRSDAFIAIPALGPLVCGHALIVTIEHAVGLTYLGNSAHEDYNRLSLQLRQYCGQRGDSLLEVEHGAAFPESRGPCISHTHIHLLPGLGNAVNVLGSRLPPISIEHRITRKPRVPYIWLSNGAVERRYDASTAIGQETRRALGSYLSLDDWDWALRPRWDVVDATLNYWKGIQ
jgi:diadenosine tetraphosphate (Ap4A) HIT family hydrolase